MISKMTGTTDLNGLVLAGGRSTRLGMDKGTIKWHGREQCYCLADMLKQFCEEAFISCRQEQVKEFNPAYKTLSDTFPDMGPFGAVLSALHAQRNKAWLVIACDLPLLDEETIRFLIMNRAPQMIATTYKSPHDGLPEPLIGIWEPASRPILINFLRNGITSLRKVLISSKMASLQPPYPESLMNVNTMEDAEKAKSILNTKNASLS
jgi:molybdopterin-guanine dinucleotide biosynthesis protein A